jgi:hypothetical protein
MKGTQSAPPAWEAEVMDPKSKLIVAHERGRRGEALIHL